MPCRIAIAGSFVALAGCIVTSNAHAHGFAGKRFFPATLAIDDSFVNPELDFLYRNDKVRDDSGNAVYLSGLSVEFAQPLARGFALFIGDTYLHQNPAGPGAVQNGFDNVEIGSKYQVFIHDQEESALAVGLNAELGGTGSKHVSASSFTTLSPVIYYSKGLGNLPIQGLRPFAVTAQIAPNFPTSPRDPHTLDWGFTVQYSLPYLEDFVRYTGLGAPFRNMFPIVEFANETCLDRNCGGQTTGSINPGVIWMGKSTQLAVELNVPVNHRSGSHVGFMLQYHLYLDDIFPSLKR